MKLQGKTAIVTGGGTGAGLAIARSLASEGCQTVIGGRRQEKLDEAIAGESTAVPILGHVLDVADRESVATFFAWARDQIGDVDILVNNAGINIVDRRMDVTTAENWDLVMGINATGAFNCFAEVLPAMRERKDGLIVNISSVAGKRASSLGGVAYSASKFAMTALGSTVGLEVADCGVRITNIYPGEINTPILENRPVKVSDEHKQRILQPEDIAATVLMVACLPPRANVPELVIKPTLQEYC
jgi:NADP-dependent 3-hydroxy acid dehydrogenase YdfG